MHNHKIEMISMLKLFSRLEPQSVLKVNLKYMQHVFMSVFFFLTDTVGSVASAEMLFRTNLIALVGGGKVPRFDEKAGKMLLLTVAC